MENASVENASTEMHGWNTQVRKTQVKICRGGKRKYGNGKNDLDNSSTDEYEWEDVADSRHSPVAASSSTTPSATVVTASCDVCLNAPRVKLWTCNFLSTMC